MVFQSRKKRGKSSLNFVVVVVVVVYFFEKDYLIAKR